MAVGLPEALQRRGRVPAIIVPIFGEPKELEKKAESAALKGADLIEWRADLSTDWEGCLEALANATIPVIATIRTDREGGEFAGSDSDYEQAVLSLAQGPVAVVDVEINRPPAHGLIARLRHLGISVIASHHNFELTPRNDDIVHTVELMAEAEADLFKIAFMPAYPDDTWRHMELSRELRGRYGVPIISISMGPEAAWTRLAAGSLGSVATFASLDSGSAPGQIDVTLVRDVLHALGG